MHDWTLLNICIDWTNGSVTVKFLNSMSKEVELIVNGLVDIHIPRMESWGRSVSVNEVQGPHEVNNKIQKLTIEMQSGDTIEILAGSFQLP